MSEDLSTRITVEIEKRLKSHSGEVDYFICLMAQNDAQSQARIATLHAEVRDLRAALENALPIADLPANITNWIVDFDQDGCKVRLYRKGSHWSIRGEAPTPRAAFLAAIDATRHE